MKEQLLEKLTRLQDWSKTRPEAKEVRLLLSKAKQFIRSIRDKQKDDSNSANLSPQ